MLKLLRKIKSRWIDFGVIHFRKLNTRNGGLWIDQHWNPSLITKAKRKEIAATLHEIADHIEDNEFEDDGKYSKYTLL